MERDGTDDVVAALRAVRAPTAAAPRFRIVRTPDDVHGVTVPPQVEPEHKRRRSTNEVVDEPATTTPRTDPSDAKLATTTGKVEVRVLLLLERWGVRYKGELPTVSSPNPI